MKFIDLPDRLQARFDLCLDAIRVYLGLGLFIKGISFLMHGELLANAFQGSPLAGFVPVVPYVHIVAGIMLAAGVLTRIAAIVLWPIVFAAVFLVHAPRLDTLHGREAVEFSALVLFLLTLIAVKGSGPLSLMRLKQSPSGESKVQLAESWLDQHADLFVDAIRIYLGVGLIIKGAFILEHRDAFLSMIDSANNIPFLAVSAAHYVIPAHFVGGALLIFGLLTRWAALAQIPPLLGALFYMFMPAFSLIELRQSFEFTALVLFLLALISAVGAGRFSVDNSPRRVLAPEPALQPVG